MREILFRGKFDNGNCMMCWIEGDLIHYSDDKIYIVDQNHNFNNIHQDGVEIENTKTIGQYIGLKDKNGTKIFEGDILRISIKDSDDKIEYKFGAVEFSDKTLGYIIRSKGGLMCSFNTILNSAGFYEFELEVIGNIYDNKDLLK